MPPSSMVIRAENSEEVTGTVGPYPLHGTVTFICEVKGGKILIFF